MSGALTAETDFHEAMNELIRFARRDSFSAGLQANKYAYEKELGRKDDEIRQLKTQLATATTQRDNARGAVRRRG